MVTDQNSIIEYGTELFQSVFRKKITKEIFEHKHFANPTRLEAPGLIEMKENQPIGMHWMMRQNFNFLDKELVGVQGSDDAIISSARGGFTFMKLRLTSVKVMKEDNIDFEYGCFAKGQALQIAEQFGEKEIVDLYLARLFLREKTHRWKRFDIKYPPILSKHLYKKRLKKVDTLRDKNCIVSISKSCPFTSDDYKIINNSDMLHAVRNKGFYQWKTGKKDSEKIEYVVARKDDNLVGFVIFDISEKVPYIVDWDVFSENKVNILASLIYPCMREFEYIDIPYINIESGEMQLFTSIGCKDMSKLWAPACICVKIINENCREYVTKPKIWKLRLIDADYYLNT